MPEVLVEELARVRERGYARSVDETEVGMSSLAVPVRAPLDGPVVAAISMVGPTARVVGDHEAHHAGVLQAGARKLREPRSSRATTAAVAAGVPDRRYQG